MARAGGKFDGQPYGRVNFFMTGFVLKIVFFFLYFLLTLHQIIVCKYGKVGNSREMMPKVETERREVSKYFKGGMPKVETESK